MISINNRDAAEISKLLEFVHTRFSNIIKRKIQTVIAFENNKQNEIKRIQEVNNLPVIDAAICYEKAVNTYKNEIIELQQQKNKTKDYINILKFGSLENVTVPRVDITF